MRVIKAAGDSTIIYLFITSFRLFLKLKIKMMKDKGEKLGSRNKLVMTYLFIVVFLNIFHMLMGPAQLCFQIYFGKAYWTSWFHFYVAYYTSEFVIPSKDILCAFGFAYLYYYQGTKSEVVTNRNVTDSQPGKDVDSVKHLLSINNEEYMKSEGSSEKNAPDESR